MAQTKEDSAETESKVQRERSPSYPFVSLKTAIERLGEFDQKFGRSEPPANRVYLAWGFKGDTSQAQQTLAALKSFGLVTYRGTGPKRLVAISEEGRTYLRAQQDSVKRDIIKRLALRPKWIAHFWPLWAAEPPPDEIRLDALVLEHKFNENAAPKFLKVYDETIGFSGLSNSDKIPLTDEGDGLEGSEGSEANTQPPPPAKQETRLMAGERVVFTEEGQPSQYLKLIAAGDVDDVLLEALEDFVRRQRKRLKAAEPSSKSTQES